MPIPCSRNAHDQNVLVRRAQWDQHGCHSSGEKYKRALMELGWNIKRPQRATDRTTLRIWTLVRIVILKNVSGIFWQPRNSSRRRFSQLERWNRGGYDNNKVEQTV